MTLIYESDLSDPHDLLFRDRTTAEVVEWQGRRAVKLSGLALLPSLNLTEGHIEVQIGADGMAYPGIAFRVADVANYELAYAQPHTSGLWDTIQYDPVFHGSNTWQLHHGDAYQKTATVPTGAWFTFAIDYKDRWARIRVGDQAPLVVSRLAQPPAGGLIGLWTFLPAYFCDLRVTTVVDATPPSAITHPIDPGNIAAWFVEGFGVIACESTGILNLNRHLPASLGQVRLSRRIEVSDTGSIELEFGFSDDLTLQIDDQVIFTGQNIFHDVPAWNQRGYVAPTNRMRHPLAPGRHQLIATLKSAEPYFGWGLIVNLHGDNFKLLPANLG
jgi:hypothetical protein